MRIIIIILTLLIIGCTSKEEGEKTKITEAQMQEVLELINQDYTYNELPSFVKKVCDKHNFNTVSLDILNLPEIKESLNLESLRSYRLAPCMLISHPSIYEILIGEDNFYYICVNNNFIGQKLYGPGKIKEAEHP